MKKELEINGINQLTEEDQSIVNKLVEKRLNKIERQIKNDFSLNVLIKEYEKDGKSKKYSVDFTLRVGNKYFKSKDTDWKLSNAVNSSLDKLQTEIEHKFHVSEQK